jgi:hypothetical protein
MKQHLSIFTALFAALLCCSFLVFKNTPQLKNGDVVFITNQSGQGKAIQLATRSNYTHVGIVFIENGKPFVYHAVEPVSKNTLEEFINMSEDGKYAVKRLKGSSSLTPQKIDQMLKEANMELGKHYDIGFNWSDDELYCSEFVWKLYNHSLKISIGDLKPLKSFDLSHPKVKHIMEQRYGKNIPYDEKMISPGDMFNSALLVDVKQQ